MVATSDVDSKPIVDNQQFDAIVSHGTAILIVAGAGTGKTTVLSSRLAYLVNSRISNPEEILVLSSTYDDANSVRMRAGRTTQSDPRYETVLCDTFYGFCFKIIRENFALLSLNKDCTLADENDQVRIILSILEKHNIKNQVSYALAVLKEIMRWNELGLSYNQIPKRSLASDISNIAYKIYTEYKNKLISLSALDEGDLLLNTLLLFRENNSILEFYRSKYKHILVDEFQDVSPAQYDILRMLFEGNTKLKQPKRLPKSEFSFDNEMHHQISWSQGQNYEREFTFSGPPLISVDEYSTSSYTASPSITTSLEEASFHRSEVNLFCVGDDDQAIYSWRNPRFDVVRRFRHDFHGGKVLSLATTYRMSEALCRPAASIVSGLADRIPKALLALSEQPSDHCPCAAAFSGEEVSETKQFEISLSTAMMPSKLPLKRESLQVWEAQVEADELQWISRYLADLQLSCPSRISATPWNYTIAVLVRTRHEVKRITDELNRIDVKHHTRGVAKWVMPTSGPSPLNLLRLLASPHNNLAFQSAIENDIITSFVESKRFLRDMVDVIQELAAILGTSFLEASRTCVGSSRLPENYNDALRLFLQKYDSWSRIIRSNFARGPRGSKVVNDILCSAYSERLSDAKISETIKDLSSFAAGFDSFEEFVSAIRAEGDHVLEEADSACTTAAPARHLSGLVDRLSDWRREGIFLQVAERPNMREYRGLLNSIRPVTPQLPSSKLTDLEGMNTLTGDAVNSPQISIWVMTIPTARGLEFDQVILPFSIETKRNTASTPQEQRLAYMSVTRARDRVLVTYSLRRNDSATDAKPNKLSRILESLISDRNANGIHKIPNLSRKYRGSYHDTSQRSEKEKVKKAKKRTSNTGEKSASQSKTKKTESLDPFTENHYNLVRFVSVDYLRRVIPLLDGNKFSNDFSGPIGSRDYKNVIKCALSQRSFKRGRIPIVQEEAQNNSIDEKSDLLEDWDTLFSRRESPTKPISSCSVKELSQFLLSIMDSRQD